LSPASLYTETAPLLPSPPQPLLSDPMLADSIRALRDSIKVETPFNVDRFETLLIDHPNGPFVVRPMRRVLAVR
jgi:hypothetical protein